MRHSIPELILEKMIEAGQITADVFFPKKYPWAAISRPLFGLDSNPSVSPPTLSSTIWRLKRQGLIRKKGNGKSSVWSITEDGKKWFYAKMAETEYDLLPEDNILRLVIFDIPERERKKRDTLRARLVAHRFERLQKSVWAGRRPLSEDFIELCDELNLKGKVHIFSVQKEGTLES